MKNLDLNFCNLEEIDTEKLQEISGGIKLADVKSVSDAIKYLVEQIF